MKEQTTLFSINSEIIYVAALVEKNQTINVDRAQIPLCANMLKLFKAHLALVYY